MDCDCRESILPSTGYEEMEKCGLTAGSLKEAIVLALNHLDPGHAADCCDDALVVEAL